MKHRLNRDEVERILAEFAPKSDALLILLLNRRWYRQCAAQRIATACTEHGTVRTA